MRIALISDIHGNWEALNAVASDIRHFRAEAILCLGDVVGYGADPGACVAWVAGHCRLALRGNHEAALLDPDEAEMMNAYAARAIAWTAEQLPPSQKELISGWPLTASESGSRLVHASPNSPEQFLYLTSQAKYRKAFSAFGEKICFFGHTHMAQIAEWNPTNRRLEIIPAGRFSLRPECRYLINIGSVGQPRDGDPRSRWVLWEGNDIEYHWVEYPVEAAQRKIIEAGLPELLAVRLKYGN